MEYTSNKIFCENLGIVGSGAFLLFFGLLPPSPPVLIHCHFVTVFLEMVRVNFFKNIMA